MERFAALEAELRRHSRAELRFDSTSRRLYSTDASIYQVEPLGVALPRTTDDLVSVLQIALGMGVPIVPRGGGTSLTGQSIGSGLIVDCSKYLNRIEFGPGDTAIVQPGVVLDELNRAAGPKGLQFGPEVATASRATLGGMIGNNSAGSRSIAYGRTVDHVLALKVMLADGTVRTFDSSAKADPLTDHFRRIIADKRAAIRAAFPKIQRRVSGYNLVDCLDTPSLIPLLVGSEGTLAFLLEAKLRLIPKPKQRGLIVPQFASLRSALDALAICLEFRPSAVELMDSLLIRLAKKQRGLADSFRHVTGDPAALLMVELTGEERGEVESRSERLMDKLRAAGGLTDVVRILQGEEREKLWNARRSAVPLLYCIRGPRKPITFVEDTTVAPEVLPQFADDFRAILRTHGADGAFYGHASVGCLHIRPLLDPHDIGDLARMNAIMRDVTALVRSYSGSLSGEHGDGLARSAQNRAMFGDEVYGVFQDVKRVFDPKNLLNPGKIVDGQPLTANLRYPPTERIALATVPTVFDYSKQEGFFNSAELCNGSGVCRKTQGGTMCPSYRATKDERDTPRGRANAVRHVLTDGEPLGNRWLHEVMDLCLSCKACKTECPSNVDVAKLKAEHLAARYETHWRPLGHYAAKYVDRLNRIGGRYPRLTNWASGLAPVKRLMGFHPSRSLPRFARSSFFDWFARRHEGERGKSGGGERKILVFADCLTSYTEPQIGRATVEVLERLGYRVELAAVPCCGRAKMSKGFLREAKANVAELAPKLAEQLRGADALTGWEPSCVVALKDEWMELVISPDTEAIAAKTHLIDDWLADRLGELQPLWKAVEKQSPAVLHGHCHQKAVLGIDKPLALLKAIPGLEPKLLDTGCCGMAGSFGYEREHFEISRQIAELSLLPQLRENSESIVIADGTSCRHQIADYAGRKSRHLIEVVAGELRGKGD